MAAGDRESLALSQSYERLTQEIEQLQQAVAQLDVEIQGCEDAVESLETIEDGSDVLVPLGGDARVRANVKHVDEVVVGVGADTSVELERDDAVDVLEDKIDELENAKQELRNEVESRRQELEDVARRAQSQMG